MEPLRHWNKLKTPPPTALKSIQAGRLKGKTDINPQWRYQAMTEAFGPAGMGWKYTIERLWTEPGTEGQVCAFALVQVQVKEGEAWSEAVPGIGGSMLIEKETKGLHTSDEAFKMAVTDALSVALKMFGVGADIYLGMNDSKYGKAPKEEPRQEHVPQAGTVARQLHDELMSRYFGQTWEANAKLKEVSGFTDKDGNERFLTLQDLCHPKVSDKWVSGALRKLTETKAA